MKGWAGFRVGVVILSLGLFLGLGLPHGILSAEPQSEWEEVSREDGVTVFRKEVPGSPVLMFKGIATIPFPIAKVMTVLRDTPGRREWTYRVKKAVVLREITPLERIEYMHTSAPWPVTDRDVVYRSKLELIETPPRRVSFFVESIEDPKYPPTEDKIRAQIYPSRFTLWPVDSGRQTHIEAEIHGDPKGSIPKWVVNRIQQTAPRKSLQNLIRYMKKGGIVDDPLVVQFFKEQSS